jgi:ADP-heptose:LPS heptosyltransferase
MKPRTIKWIDFWAGVPLCFLLSVYARLVRAAAPRRRLARRSAAKAGPAAAPRKILFLKLIEQGATVLAYPALTRAVDLVGRSNVFFCVFAENRPILDVLDVIPSDNIFEIRQRNLFLFLGDTLRFLLKARRAGIDAILDMEFFSRASALLCYLSGARTRVGCHRYTSEYPYRGNLMTHRVQYNPYLDTARAYLLLVECLARPASDTPMPKFRLEDLPLATPRFHPSEEQRRRVETLLLDAQRGPQRLSTIAQGAPSRVEERGSRVGVPEPVPERSRADAPESTPASSVPRRPFVIVNPNAGDMLPLRKWPSAGVVELVRRLLQTGEAGTIIVTGSASERDAVDTMFAEVASERILNLAGRTDLVDLITLYGMADAIVTNDSGPAHFATLAGVPTVVLFGPETPRLFRPLGRHVHVLYEKLACSPCVNVFNHRFSPCTDNACMRAITVDRVFDEVHRILERGPRS